MLFWVPDFINDVEPLGSILGPGLKVPAIYGLWAQVYENEAHEPFGEAR